MNVGAYDTEYKKVVLKELLKNSISTKNKLLVMVSFCNDKEKLENIRDEYNLDEKEKQDVELFKLAGKDKELIALLEQDMKLLTELKKMLDKKIEELKQKDNQEDKEEKDESKESEKEDVGDETSNEEQEEEQDDGELDEEESDKNETEKESDNDGIAKLASKAFIRMTLSKGDFFTEVMKLQIVNIIQDIDAINDLNNGEMVPESLEFLQQNRGVFVAAVNVGLLIQNLRNCDRELFMLAGIMVRSAGNLLRTIDIQMARYNDKLDEQIAKRGEEDIDQFQGEKQEVAEEIFEGEFKDEQGETEEVKETEDTDEERDTEEEQEGEIEGQDIEEDSEEIQTGETINRKYWELSPEDKADIQRQQSETGKNFDPNTTRDMQTTRGEENIETDIGR